MLAKKNAKLAKLDYEVITYNEVKNLSLLKINLHTGRHHQIRVQLSNFGHSIFGDQKYGTRGQGKQIALWAYKLTIEHPISKEKITFTDLPDTVGTWCILKDINNLYKTIKEFEWFFSSFFILIKLKDSNMFLFYKTGKIFYKIKKLK